MPRPKDRLAAGFVELRRAGKASRYFAFFVGFVVDKTHHAVHEPEYNRS